MSGKTPQKHLKADPMRPPFPLKDIALQSGLSLATVDRALHRRGHVAKATGLRIEAAIAELERQYAEARIGGRRLIIDVVMETPQRFSNAVRAAFEAELPGMRQGYVGMDNRVAGATAAYLLARMAGPAAGKVLVTLSSARFSGEEERQRGFRDALEKDAPHLGTVTISEGFGVDRTTERLVKAALVADPEIRAVYSIGGGNRAILRAFAEERRRIDVIAAHDLDADNRALLAEGRLTFVIHHDLRQDARSACQMVMAHHRMLPRDFQVAASRVAIATPHEGM